MNPMKFPGLLLLLAMATAVHATAPRESNLVSTGGGYSMESDVTISGMGEGIQSAGAYEILPERDASTATATQTDWVLYE